MKGAPGAQSACPWPGQMTEAASLCQGRSSTKRRWNDAAQAVAPRRSTAKPGDDPGNKQLAEYFLAISPLSPQVLPRRATPSSAWWRDNPNHVKVQGERCCGAGQACHAAARRPADESSKRVGKYNDEQGGPLRQRPNRRDLYWQLNYMLGPLQVPNRQFEEAIRLFPEGRSP